MSTDTNYEQWVDHIIERLASRDQRYIEDVQDILVWAYYGQRVFSQFGFGYCGCVLRQSRDSVKGTVKVLEEGVPLVAFVTSATTTGCISRTMDLLYAEKLKWQKDRYPWI